MSERWWKFMANLIGVYYKIAHYSLFFRLVTAYQFFSLDFLCDFAWEIYLFWTPWPMLPLRFAFNDIAQRIKNRNIASEAESSLMRRIDLLTLDVIKWAHERSHRSLGLKISSISSECKLGLTKRFIKALFVSTCDDLHLCALKGDLENVMMNGDPSSSWAKTQSHQCRRLYVKLAIFFFSSHTRWNIKPYNNVLNETETIRREMIRQKTNEMKY